MVEEIFPTELDFWEATKQNCRFSCRESYVKIDIFRFPKEKEREKKKKDGWLIFKPEGTNLATLT